MADGLLSGGGRRAALDDIGAGLIRYIPPEWRVLAGLIAEANPVRGVERAGMAARRLAAPEAAPMERVAATGNVLSEMAGVLAPAAVAGRAGMPAVQAVQEGLLGMSAPARAAGEAVIERLNQPGPMPTLYSNPIMRAPDAVSDRGDQILGLLRAGRGQEVTDEMLDMGDPVLNTRLNEYLFRNYDLPMDEASRTARAAEMGLAREAYHGRRSDFDRFDFAQVLPAMGDLPAVMAKGFYLTPDKRYPFISKEIENEGWNVIPGRVRMENPRLTSSESTIEGMNVYSDAHEYIARLKGEGHDALVYADPRDLTKGASGWGNDFAQYFIFDPRNIRSRFARFDPRLAHLRNLSAGIGALGLLNMPSDEELRLKLSTYLNGG